MTARRLLGASICFSSTMAGYFFLSNNYEKRTPVKREGKLLKDLVTVEGYQIHKDIVKTLDKIRDFRVKDDDIFIMSFPKSGTTWLQEIVFLITSNLNFGCATSTNLDERSPFLEFPCPGIGSINQMKSPRIIKTHLPFSLLPKDIHRHEKIPKVIYVARNPRDVCISYYHFCQMLTFIKFEGEFSTFYNEFANGRVPYGPWNDHVLEYWKLRHRNNFLFITYEALQLDTDSVIKQIAQFLGGELSDSDIVQIREHCQFNKMSKNQHSNYSWLKDLGLLKSKSTFMRKGKVGDWENYLSEDMCNRLDDLALTIVDKKDSPKFIYSLQTPGELDS